MKYLYSCLVLINIVFFTSCVESTAPIDEIEHDIDVSEPCNQSLSNNNSVTEPHPSQLNREVTSGNFDWQNSGTVSFGIPNGKNVPVLLPWASGVSSTIPGDITRGLLLSEQWTLLYDTFKISRAGIEIPHLFLMFYNVYSGKIRVLYFRQQRTISDNSRSVIWTIQFTNQTSAQNQSGPIAFTADKRFSNRRTGNVYSSILTNTMSEAWHYADFEIAYDPEIKQYEGDEIHFRILGSTSIFDTSPYDLIKPFDSNDPADCYNEITNTRFFSYDLIVPGTNTESIDRGFFPNPDLDFPLGVFALTGNPEIILTRSVNKRSETTAKLNKDSYEIVFNPKLLEVASIENVKESIEQVKYGNNSDKGLRISFDVVPDNGSETVHIDKIFKAQQVINLTNSPGSLQY